MQTMRSRFFILFLSTVSAALACAAPSGAELSAQNNGPPNWVASALKVSSAEESQRVTIAAYLSFRNQAALDDLITAVSTPGSKLYGKYLTPAQFRAQFAPNAADVARVQSTLQKLGFHVDYTPASGLFVEASGTVAQVKASFGVSQNLYSYKGKLLRANAEAPTIPAAIADIVTVVAGLDDSAMLRQPDHLRLTEQTVAVAAVAAASGKTPNAPPPVQDAITSVACSTYWADHQATLSTVVPPYAQTLPWLMCGYTPQQLRTAYGADQVKETGKGVTVGIVDIYGSPTIVADANRYSANHGLPSLTAKNFTQILPAGIYNVPASDPCGPQGWYEEESLDIESVHSMAPGANIVFAGDVCDDPANAPLYSLIDEHTADIVTNSYGYDGEDLPAWFITVENQYFQQAASEGMSIVFSSGDDGDLAAINGEASGSWEATSPYVTGVGGTSLALNANGTKQEWGWGTERVFLNGVTVPANGAGTIKDSGAALPFAFYAGAGGGPSLIELAPAYQAYVPTALSEFTYDATSGTEVYLGKPHRVTPDVAMVADPYTGFLYGETFIMANPPTPDPGCVALTIPREYCEGSIGGTSLASPLFAGVLALVNQARAEIGSSAVGFVNPALYALDRSDSSGPYAAITDVNKPTSPTAVLRGYVTNLHELRVVTMNSTPHPLVEGTDTSLRTTAGYDNVTGVGTPNVPAFIEALLLY
jgi:subtilase family serine protease